MFSKSKKAQGSLEYLLIIGGALLIAIVAITVILSLGKANNESANESQENYQELVDNTIISPIITDINCSTTLITIYTNGSPTNGVSNYRYNLDDGAYIDVSNIQIANGYISAARSGISKLTIGDKHEITLVAIKNNSRSLPTIPFECTVK